MREELGFVEDKYLLFALVRRQVGGHLHFFDLVDAYSFLLLRNHVYDLNVSMLGIPNAAAGIALLAGTIL